MTASSRSSATGPVDTVRVTATVDVVAVESTVAVAEVRAAAAVVVRAVAAPAVAAEDEMASRRRRGPTVFTIAATSALLNGTPTFGGDGGIVAGTDGDP
jgi:hypothetical protein